MKVSRAEIDRIQERLRSLPQEDWQAVTRDYYYGSGYGEVTHFVRMGEELLEIGTQLRENPRPFYAISKFIASSKTDIEKLLYALEHGIEEEKQ